MIGKRLKSLREDIGLTQLDVAEFLRVSRTTYTQYETEKSEPDLATVSKLSGFFNVSVDYLLGRTDYRVADSPAPYRKQIPGDSVTTAQGRRIIDSLARADSLDNDDYDMIAAQVEKLIEYAEKKKHSKAPEKK